jgi:hypothetical protein
VTISQFSGCRSWHCCNISAMPDGWRGELSNTLSY